MGTKTSDDGDGGFDIVLFCHNMYGMKPPVKVIEWAMDNLDERYGSGMVVVFHRDGPLNLGRLVYHRATSSPAGITLILDEDAVLDRVAAFLAGFALLEHLQTHLGSEWRTVCRTLGRREEEHPGYL